MFNLIKKLFKFCSICGSKLIFEDSIDGYDMRSGKPIIKQRALCSKDKDHDVYANNFWVGYE